MFRVSFDRLLILACLSLSGFAAEKSCYVQFRCESDATKRIKKLENIGEAKCKATDTSPLSEMLKTSMECGTDSKSGKALEPRIVRTMMAFSATPSILNKDGKMLAQCVRFTRCYAPTFDGSYPWREPVAYSWITSAGDCSAAADTEEDKGFALAACQEVTGSKSASNQGWPYHYNFDSTYEARWHLKLPPHINAKAGSSLSPTH